MSSPTVPCLSEDGDRPDNYRREPDGTPVTQILYIDVDPAHILEDADTPAGKLWVDLLDLLQDAPGFRRLYWGQRLEEPEKVQVHVVRDTFDAHKAFLASSSFQDDVTALIRRLTSLPLPAPVSTSDSSPASAENITTSSTNTPPPPSHHNHHHPPPPKSQLPLTIRHVLLHTHAHPSPLAHASTLGLPVGTAIYTGASETWYSGSWPLWTHIVRRVVGCVGVSGGRVLEPVAGLDEGYAVYVAWRSVAAHDEYHQTRHFARFGVVLGLGHRGYVEYGHVVFKGVREGVKEKL